MLGIMKLSRQNVCFLSLFLCHMILSKETEKWRQGLARLPISCEVDFHKRVWMWSKRGVCVPIWSNQQQSFWSFISFCQHQIRLEESFALPGKKVRSSCLYVIGQYLKNTLRPKKWSPDSWERVLVTNLNFSKASRKTKHIICWNFFGRNLTYSKWRLDSVLENVQGNAISQDEMEGWLWEEM